MTAIRKLAAGAAVQADTRGSAAEDMGTVHTCMRRREQWGHGFVSRSQRWRCGDTLPSTVGRTATCTAGDGSARDDRKVGGTDPAWDEVVWPDLMWGASCVTAGGCCPETSGGGWGPGVPIFVYLSEVLRFTRCPTCTTRCTTQAPV